MPHLEWGALRRDEVSALLADGAIAALPTGALEQHGEHLPTETDNHLVVHVLREASIRSAATIVTLPLLPYGFSPYHLRFGATVSFSAHTYLNVLSDICSSVREAGTRTLVILNGHGGNTSPMKMASHDASTDNFHVVTLSYWDIANDSAAQIFTEDGEFGHAGQAETSLLLATRPESVGRLPELFEPLRDGVRPPTVSLLGESGVIGNPNAASAALGQEFLEIVIARIANAFDAIAAPHPAFAPSISQGGER